MFIDLPPHTSFTDNKYVIEISYDCDCAVAVSGVYYLQQTNDNSVSSPKSNLALETNYLGSKITDERWIGDIIDDLISQVPDEEWQKIPHDLSSNIDEYLYHGKT